MCEKIAFKIVESNNTEEVNIDVKDVEDYIGPSHFRSSKMYKVMPPGVIVGLAYNEYGGSTLYIEA
jgi:ATP-dependent Lon protease